jgi:hypothetical protein
MEYPEKTVERLRAELGRDPTPDEIKAERDRLWKLNLADRAFTAMCFADDELRTKLPGVPYERDSQG